MRAISYKNTETNIPTCGNLHESLPYGVAYETDTHFVHFYCSLDGWWVLNTGMTALESKEGTLEDWVTRVFGATEICEISNGVGDTFKSIWRPGLSFDSMVYDGVGSSMTSRHQGLITIRILLKKLEDILEYVELSDISLHTYSHKSRELLILACTEVENQFQRYMSELNIPAIGRNYSTSDYVKLFSPLHLSEFKMHLKPYPVVGDIVPFGVWDANQPTRSLEWYDAYNKTKHNRDEHFDKATILNCIHAICATIVLFSVRHSPYAINTETSITQSLFQQLFLIKMPSLDQSSWYVPKIILPEDVRRDLFCFDGSSDRYMEPWATRLFAI